jgi:hypothetical protein
VSIGITTTGIITTGATITGIITITITTGKISRPDIVVSGGGDSMPVPPFQALGELEPDLERYASAIIASTRCMRAGSR